ncbi:ABC transporter substrate-binding protein [Blautia producta]|uniref:Extracellular solute-binding protein n=1 Tax=Blautia producta TaxID=33035 RepID=A0A4P6LXX5_9FIRM|nr:extracellular solute-binding protein [Blautia producta]QBE96969.1 hypothetical protein PMF13cell1_02518 [Blautia producta]
MKKRWEQIMAVLLAGTIAVSMAACGADSKEKEPSADAGSSESQEKEKDQGSDGASEVKSIEVWFNSDEQVHDNMVKMFDAYKDKTGIEITYTNLDLDSMHDKVIASASAGNKPDVIFGLPEWISEFNAMGITADLTDYYNSWDDKNNFYDSTLEAMKVDGNYVAIPWSSTVRACLIHEDINKEAGIGTESPTWEELLDMTDYYEKTGAYPYGITCTGARAPQELLVHLAEYDLEICSEQEGGGYRNTWNENEKELENAAKVFQFYKDLVANGIVDPSSATYGWEETDVNYASGLTGMFTTGNWLANYEEEYPDTMMDTVIKAVPAPSDGKTCTYLEAKPMFVFDNGDKARMDAAFDVAAYISGKEFVETCYPAYSSRTDVKTDDKWTKDFQALTDSAVTFPPVVLGNITQAMTDSLAKALQENMDAKEVAKWLGDAINSSLKGSGELAE